MEGARGKKKLFNYKYQMCIMCIIMLYINELFHSSTGYRMFIIVILKESLATNNTPLSLILAVWERIEEYSPIRVKV